jgi:putative endonuclease
MVHLSPRRRKKTVRPWFVYLIETDDAVLYAGTALDVGKRFAQHREGRGAKFFRMHPPKRIVYVERHPSKGKALRREAEIKRFSRAAKRDLCRQRPGERISLAQALRCL